MADHLPHMEALLPVRLRRHVVEITEAHDTDEGIIGCLARKPNGGRNDQEG